MLRAAAAAKDKCSGPRFSSMYRKLAASAPEREDRAMSKGTRQTAEHRRDEIIDACAELYRDMPFREVTMKKIAEKTSFSRPSIYNYFETIEEIFLGLLQREVEEWRSDLDHLAASHDSLTQDELISEIAHTLERRGTMLRIQSMNLYEIEDNSRVERLTDFKNSYCAALQAFDRLLEKFLPGAAEDEITDFRYTFFPFLSGIYPYTDPTPKQIAAMDAAGMPHENIRIYDAVCRGLRKMLPCRDAEAPGGRVPE